MWAAPPKWNVADSPEATSVSDTSTPKEPSLFQWVVPSGWMSIGAGLGISEGTGVTAGSRTGWPTAGSKVKIGPGGWNGCNVIPNSGAQGGVVTLPVAYPNSISP